MRTSSFDGATIEYPDLIAFAFNPIIMRISSWLSDSKIKN